MSQIRNTVVAINLGKCLYYARCERFNLSSVAWEALDVADRHAYTQRANDVLDSLRHGPEPKPGDFAAFTATVIGGANDFRTR